MLVSAGGTREPLDAVRFVGNRSSGRMGVALAAEARRRGAEVTLLAANLAVPAPPGVEVVETPTAADLEREALARADADVVVMAAAVADYRPAERARRQAPEGRPRRGGRARADASTCSATLGARRRERPGARRLRRRRRRAGLERAREKLATRTSNLIVFNDVSRDDIGFDAADNEVTLVSAHGERAIAKAPKEAIAAAILDEVGRLLEESDGRGAVARPEARRRRRPRRSSGSPTTSRASCTRRDETLRLVVLCLVSEGHLIIEDFPGVGKTMLAKALARSLDCSLLAPPVHARPAARRT